MEELDKKEYNITPTPESKTTVDKPIKKKGYVSNRISLNTGYKIDENIYENFDSRKYEDSVNNGNVFMPTGNIDALNLERANNQSWTQQAGNMIGQAVVGEIIGGTIEGLGYLLELGDVNNYIDGTEKQWGNFITDAGKDLREFSQDRMAIHQTNPGSFNMSDSGWWFGNGVSVASSLSMLLPSMVGAKGLAMLGKGVSKGAGLISKSMDIAAKMGKYETWMAKGITQAVVSRHIENSMEASGTFQSKREELLGTVNPKTGEVFTEEDATQFASDAASSNYRAGWAMLLQDIPQYLAIGKVFNPASMKFESAVAKAVSNGTKPGLKSMIAKKGGAALGAFASEGFEESYQYYIAERGKLLSDLSAGLITEEEYDKKLGDKVGDEEMMTSAFFGGLGGNVFQAVGPATSELFKSKERKSYEKNYKVEQGNALKERGRAFVAMNNEIMKADQGTDPSARQKVINESMVQMTMAAIDSDQFDSHIAQLEGMSDMSEDERVGFEKDLGIELDPKMFQEHIPEAIKTAYEIRDSYFKHLNKFDASISNVLARNDYHTKTFDNRSKDALKELNDIKSSIPMIDKLSKTYDEMASIRGNITALKTTNAIHKQEIKKTDNTHRAKDRQDLVDRNEKKIESLVKKLEEVRKSDSRTPEEKDEDKFIGEGYKESSSEMVNKATEIVLLADAINLLQKDNARLKTPGYQKEVKEHSLIRDIKNIKTKEELDSAIQNLTDNKDMSPEQSTKALVLLQKRSEEIEAAIKAEAAKEARAAASEELTTTNEKKNEVNAISIPDAIIPEKQPDNFEDDFADEEVNITKKLEDQAEKVADERFKNNSENASLFGRTGSPLYKEWLTNGVSKVGIGVIVEVGNSFSDSNATKAIEDFNNGVINENVYNFLPIKVVIDGVEDNFVYMSAFLPKFMVKEGYASAWDNKHFPTRKRFIDSMVSNSSGKVASKITHQYGGRVVRDNSNPGTIPENLISDMPQLINTASKAYGLNGEQPSIQQLANAVDLMFTNEDGLVMNADKKLHQDYEGTMMTIPGSAGVNKAAVPMTGTVFMNTTKADGTKFPLKLNIRKHTEKEAVLLTELLSEIINKRAEFKTPISLLSDELRVKVMEDFKDEVDVLGGDPKLIDLINLFTYINEKTKGKNSELYIKNSWVLFDNGKNKLTPEETTKADSKGKSTADQKNDLYKFLLNNKRRQVDVKLWKSNAKYREYIIGKGILSTDAVVNQPLFGTDGPELDVYISAPEVSVKKTTKTANEVKDDEILASRGVHPAGKRMVKSRIKNESKDKKGNFTATHYDVNNKETVISRKDKGEAIKAVMEMYDKESLSQIVSKDIIESQKVNDKEPLETDANNVSLNSEIIGAELNEAFSSIESINESPMIEDNLSDMSFDEELDITIETEDDGEISYLDGITTTEDFDNTEEDGFEINCTK